MTLHTFSIPSSYSVGHKYVGLLDRTASSTRSWVWQRRYQKRLISVSLCTKDREQAISRWKRLSFAFIKMLDVGIDNAALRVSLCSVRDKTIREAALASLNIDAVAAPVVAPVKQSSPLLSEVLSEWIGEMEGEWKPRTKAMNEKVAQRFIDWKGNVPISSISKRDVSQYKLHLEEVLKAPRSRQDALVKASGMFTFAMNKRDYIEKNVFSGMFYRAVESSSQKESITKEEHTEALNKAKGKNVIELKWMMKVLWHTGLRIGEVIQLRKEDYRKVDGVWCISINTEDGKTVKTKDSVRNIPIAQSLIDEGILDVKPVFPWKTSSSAGG